MGNHATALAKHKVQLAQVHLRAALEALKELKGVDFATQLEAACNELLDAKELFK